MEVMDFLEDEIDGHTYDDLIPLQLRMALEDQVFGWDHLASNILGHLGFTVGSYLLTFWVITFVVLRQAPWGGTGGDDPHPRSNNPLGMPHGLFALLRTTISVGAAISAFRTVRRRRHVWLRTPHGDGGSYANLAPGSREFRRRQSGLEEADRRARRFVLGSRLWAQMQRSYDKRRDRYLARRVKARLLKAERAFERGRRRRARLLRSASACSLTGEGAGTLSPARADVASARTRHDVESDHHRRVRMLAGAAGEDDDAGSVLTEDTLPTQLRRSSSSMNSHTLPNFAMESISHDQMPFADGEIKKMPYVHGVSTDLSLHYLA